MGPTLPNQRRAPRQGPRRVSCREPQGRAGKGRKDRKLLAAGEDPISARKASDRAERTIPTFADVAALVVADAQAKSTNAKVRYQWKRHLGEAYCGPLLKKPVNSITTLDVAAVLREVWRAKPEVARKLYPAIRNVFERARIVLRDEHGIEMVRNPANWPDMKAMGFEAPKKLSRGHHPSLAYSALPAFITDLRARDAVAARALEFLILTNVRTNAVLHALRSEIDLARAVWTVPLSSLKDREHRTEPFRVPLSPRAMEIIKEMEKVKVSDLVFPGQKSRMPFSNMAFLTLLKRMNSGERKWLDENTSPNHRAWIPRDVPDLGGGSSDFPARGGGAGDGSQGRLEGRARLPQNRRDGAAARAHGRVGAALLARRCR